MKVFISVGMHHRPWAEIQKDIERATLEIIKRFGDDVEIIHNGDCPKPAMHDRLYYLGEAIKKLGRCDACYFVNGWRQHKGCLIGHDVCERYSIDTLYELDEDYPIKGVGSCERCAYRFEGRLCGGVNRMCDSTCKMYDDIAECCKCMSVKVGDPCPYFKEENHE